MNTFFNFLKSDDAKKIRKIIPLLLFYVLFAIMIISGSPSTFVRAINLVLLSFISGTVIFVIIKQYSIYKNNLK